MTFLLITLYAFLVAVSFGGKLPSGFKKCNLKQTSSRLCLPKAIESALRQMDRPIKSLGLVSLEPLVIPSLTIDAGSQYVAAKHTYQNLRVSGFNETTCSKAEFNYNEKTLNLDCVVPNFRMDFNYEIHGQILMTSVFGNGTGWIIFQDNHLGLTFKLGEYEKKGKTYFSILHQQLSMQPRVIDFDVNNLFDGDQESADRVKKILKENVLEIYGDLRDGYEEAFGKIFAYIFEKVLENVPVSDIFG
ncbi:protein takeout-like isoform X1 [Zophobas morio]|uniref:protein takeout-like isoform X1 n=1 Tax=Zophobas morio TaxID=2755281 RepID=UPI003082E91F